MGMGNEAQGSGVFGAGGGYVPNQINGSSPHQIGTDQGAIWGVWSSKQYRNEN